MSFLTQWDLQYKDVCMCRFCQRCSLSSRAPSVRFWHSSPWRQVHLDEDAAEIHHVLSLTCGRCLCLLTLYKSQSGLFECQVRVKGSEVYVRYPAGLPEARGWWCRCGPAVWPEFLVWQEVDLSRPASKIKIKQTCIQNIHYTALWNTWFGLVAYVYSCLVTLNR